MKPSLLLHSQQLAGSVWHIGWQINEMINNLGKKLPVNSVSCYNVTESTGCVLTLCCKRLHYKERQMLASWHSLLQIIRLAASQRPRFCHGCLCPVVFWLYVFVFSQTLIIHGFHDALSSFGDNL